MTFDHIKFISVSITREMLNHVLNDYNMFWSISLR